MKTCMTSLTHRKEFEDAQRRDSSSAIANLHRALDIRQELHIDSELLEIEYEVSRQYLPNKAALLFRFKSYLYDD